MFVACVDVVTVAYGCCCWMFRGCGSVGMGRKGVFVIYRYVTVVMYFGGNGCARATRNTVVYSSFLRFIKNS